MGGQDWELWIRALSDAGVLADGVKTLAYSYIGTDLTWPIYWHGTLGKAKEDLDRAARSNDRVLESVNGKAYVAVMKSVITQASSAIPVMPLYVSMVFKIMREKGLHEVPIDQLDRLFRCKLTSGNIETDSEGRIRMDDWELRDDIQQACRDLWPQVTTENLNELTDYRQYKEEFLNLFGFGCDDVDYSADVNPDVQFEVVDLTR